MFTTLLTRAEYDAIVTQYPDWMATEFPKLNTNWSLGGVRCFGSREQIAVLDAYKMVVADKCDLRTALRSAASYVSYNYNS